MVRRRNKGIFGLGVGKISLKVRKWLKSATAALILAISALFLFGGCGCPKHCTGGASENTNVILRDSIIVETRIDTLEVQLPPIYVKDYTDLGDTLHLSTGTAEASVWVNQEKGLLEGEIHNTNQPIPVAVPSTNEGHFHQRDSIQIKEVPVPVEVEKKVVPTWSWWSLIFNILGVCGLVVFIVLKIKLH